MTLRVGVLGLASFYGPAYAERAASHPKCEVVAAYPGDVSVDALRTLSRPTPREFAEEYECEIHDSVSTTLDSDVDAVVVATPTRRRADDAVTALRSGVSALCAKPMADGADAARSVADAAKESDCTAMATTPARFDDAVAEMGRRVAEGKAGDILAVRAAIRHDRVPSAGIETNAEHAPAEAGAAFAMSVYTADTLLWLADSPPAEARAEYANVNTPHSEHPDLGTATVRFADDALGTMTMTYATDCRERLGNWEVEVVGTDGIIRTTHQGYEGIQWHAGPPDERSATVFGRTQSPILDRQWDAFVSTVSTDGASQIGERAPSIDHVASAIGLCEAWERSASSGASVSLPTAEK